MSNTSWNGQRRSFPAKIRRRILARDKTCQLQYPGVCTGTPEIADHIVGWADATAAGWDPRDIDDPANGQASCRPCSDTKLKAEQQRGRARAAAARPKQRPTEPHPGLKR